MPKYNPVYEAYKILLELNDRNLDPMVEEAIGYLGEALDAHPEVK